MAILEVENIYKNFGETQVLKGISFSLEQGQALAIIGASGSGKTTLLRCLNFLERPDRGIIRVNGDVLFDAQDPSTQLEKEIRKKRLNFGLVFQSFHLFPQYTVLKNVTLASELLTKEQLKHQGRAALRAAYQDIEEQARMLLDQMGLLDKVNAYPHQLSGGQQQRVALARSVVVRPNILLFDEPLSNLDAKLREKVRVEIRDLQRKLGITAIYVTHDQSEALAISDTIISTRAPSFKNPTPAPSTTAR